MREAIALLTVFGGAATPSPRALRWFPVVGVALGALVGASWWLFEQIFPDLLAAVLVVAVDLAVTGMLHLDGLADAADGLLPHASRERRLEIMRRPDIGAFGALVVGIALLARTAGFAARPADVALVAGVWCASRTVAAIAPAWLPYVRENGLVTPLLSTPATRWPVLGLAPALALGVATAGIAGAAAVGAAVVVAVGVLALGRVRLGGFTGDVLGAAIVVGETAGLVVAGARW